VRPGALGAAARRIPAAAAPFHLAAKAIDAPRAKSGRTGTRKPGHVCRCPDARGARSEPAVRADRVTSLRSADDGVAEVRRRRRDLQTEAPRRHVGSESSRVRRAYAPSDVDPQGHVLVRPPRCELQTPSGPKRRARHADRELAPRPHRQQPATSRRAHSSGDEFSTGRAHHTAVPRRPPRPHQPRRADPARRNGRATQTHRADLTRRHAT